MELKSMTDFVLQEERKGMQNTDRHLRFERILKYAHFLKQPLKLEMFVPCDEDGNVLEEPTNYEVWEEIYLKDKSSIIGFKKHESYFEAKEKVLFEGFEVKRNYIMYYDFMYMMTYELENKNIESIIEKIPNNTLTLTQNAIKQLGL